MNKKEFSFTSIENIKKEIDEATSREGIQAESKDLSSLIDMDTWVKIQNNFANAINLPVFLIEESGTEIAVSNDFPYFCKLVNSKPKGREACIGCRRNSYNELKEEGGNIKYFECHAGLFNIMTPITINKKVVGAVNCSSILKNSRNIAKVIRVAEKLGIESVELIDAVNELPIKQRDDLMFYGTLLYILSQTIPGLVNEYKTNIEKLNELEIINSFSREIQSTLKLNETLKIILNKIIEITGALDTSLILVREEESNTTYERYTYSNEKLAVIQETEKKIIRSLNEETKLKSIYIFSDLENEFNIKTNFIKKIAVIPLLMRQKPIGYIFVYLDEKTQLDHKQNELVEVLASQSSFGITNAQQFEEINTLAITDKLTGLYNRRHIMEILEDELKRAQRNERFFSLILMDIDHFSHYNNNNGHPAGDRLLTGISNLITENVREIDRVGRYGGEEIIVILPDANINEALPVAERIRKAIENEPFEHREKQPMGKITTCIGLVSYKGKNKDKEALVKYADDLLYKSKEAGRNKTSYKIIDEAISEILPQETHEG